MKFIIKFVEMYCVLECDANVYSILFVDWYRYWYCILIFVLYIDLHIVHFVHFWSLGESCRCHRCFREFHRDSPWYSWGPRPGNPPFNRIVSPRWRTVAIVGSPIITIHLIEWWMRIRGGPSYKLVYIPVVFTISYI